MIQTHVEQENLALVKRGFEAFAKRDMQTMLELFHADATWHSPPCGVLTGTYRGRDAILAFFAQLGQETEGTFKRDALTYAATGDKVFVETMTSAKRQGRLIKMQTVLVFTILEHTTREVYDYYLDFPEAAKFWK